MTLDRIKLSAQTVRDNIAILEQVEDIEDAGYYLQLEHEKIVLECIEKQIPQKPNFEGDGYDDSGNLIYDTWICPNCGDRYEVDYETHRYCPMCGQFIDWSDTE